MFFFSGVLSSILQLALVDLATAYIAVIEVLGINHRTWAFPPQTCPLFLGSETLLNCLSLYLIVLFNFHVISTCNLHAYELQNCKSNPLTSCDEGDSEEFLVSTSRHSLSNRGIVKRKPYVSTLLPSIFVWLLSISLSVPEYSLAVTLKINDNYTVCTVTLETHYKQILPYLLVLFKILMPVLLVLGTFLILLVKLYIYNCCTKPVITKRFLVRKTYTINFLLCSAIILSLVYMITSFQRLLFHFMSIKDEAFLDTLETFRISKLEGFLANHKFNVLFSMLHYSSAALRSVLYICMLPEVRENFVAGVLMRGNKGA